MDAGQVGFKDEKMRKILKNVQKNQDIVKTLEKTREERKVDFAKEKEQRIADDHARRRKMNEERKRQEKEENKKHEMAKELQSYSALQHLEKTSNADASKTGTLEECR